MAKTTRIDSVVVDGPTGKVFVNYTTGTPPLPAAPSGAQIEFASKAAYGDAIATFEEGLQDEHHVLITSASYYKTDPTLKDVATKAAGTVTTLDLTGATAILK